MVEMNWNTDHGFDFLLEFGWCNLKPVSCVRNGHLILGKGLLHGLKQSRCLKLEVVFSKFTDR